MEPGPSQLVGRRRLAVGNTSVVYAWDEGRIVKVFGPDIPTHWAQLEANWTERVHDAGLPVPEVVEVTEVTGRPAIVYQRVRGRTMLQTLVAPDADVGGIAGELAELQLWLHAVEPPSGLPRLRDRLRSKIHDAPDLDPVARARVIAELEQRRDGTALCHGDLHPGNIIVTPAGPIIVDWFDVSVGSPAADVARTSLLIRPQPLAGPPHYLPGSTNALLDRFHTAYLSHHRTATGTGAEEVAAWEVIVAVARLCEPGHHDDLAALVRDA